MTWTLSIDFGTSSTIAVGSRSDGSRELIEIDGDRRMPSVAFLDDDNTWVVGRSAVDLASARPNRAVHVPKRRLGEQTPIVVAGKPFNAPSVCAEILKVAAANATRQMGSEPEAVRLTYPAMWNRPRRTRLLTAAAEAGLATPVLIPEPVAAAHALPLEVAPGSHVAIYDLGGGTFDTTVVRATEGGFEVVGRPTGDAAFGGELFDEIIRNHVGEQLDPDAWDELQVSDELVWRRSSVRLLAECKRVKEAMSSHPYGVVIASLPNGVTEVRLTREQVEELVAPFVDESVEVLAQGIEQAGLTPADLSVIHLVGGASRMPIVLERVRAAFPNVRVEQLGDPRTAAALGAPLADPTGSQLQTIDRAAGETPTAHAPGGPTTAPDPDRSAISADQAAPAPEGQQPPIPPPAQPTRPAAASADTSLPLTPQPAPAPQPAPVAQQPATQIPAAQAPPTQPQGQQPPAQQPSAQGIAQSGFAAPVVQPAPDSGGMGKGMRYALLGALALIVVFGIGAIAGVFADRNSDRINEEVTSRSDSGITTSATGSESIGSSTTTTTASTTTTTASTTTSTTAPTTAPFDGPSRDDVDLVQLRQSDFDADWGEVTQIPLPRPDCDIGLPAPTEVFTDFSGWATGSVDDNGDPIQFRIESQMDVYETEEDARSELRREQAISRTCDTQEDVIGPDGTNYSITLLTIENDDFIIGDKGQETFTIGRILRDNDATEFTYVIGNRTRVGRTILTIWARSPRPITDANLEVFSDVAFVMVQRIATLPD